ncbi:MAG: hypothetical protein K2I98_07815, partial [Prevotella sp.]|nr:hypothetical protein [Prevotella sp.]
MRIEIAKGIQISFKEDIALKILIYVVWASMLLAFLKGFILRVPVLGDYPEIVLTMAVIIPVMLAIPALL